MEISSLTSTSISPPTGLPARAQPNPNEAQRIAEQQSNNKGAVGNIQPPPPPPPQPSVNSDGQTIGTIINITA